MSGGLYSLTLRYINSRPQRHLFPVSAVYRRKTCFRTPFTATNLLYSQ